MASCKLECNLHILLCSPIFYTVLVIRIPYTFVYKMLERTTDLHICAIRYIKSCFMLCKHVVNQENGASRYYKVLESGYIYIFFDSFGVLESNGIHPQTLSHENIIFNRYCEDRWWRGD